ncbi:hypothetical protein IW492_02855 [Enterococcus sp. BWB1-3]|nr:hypothetical protein [Enterococcus sp. BWB1-3]
MLNHEFIVKTILSERDYGEIIRDFSDVLDGYPFHIMQSIGEFDRNNCELFDDDLVKLTLPDGEVRIFRIRIKTLDREVRNHPEFVGEYSKVRITAVVFEWRGFDLFPCIDDKGISDVSKMEWVGTFWENPELLEVSE